MDEEKPNRDFRSLFKSLVEAHGIIRVALALGAVPVTFILGFKSWMGDLGFLMLQPNAFFTLSVDFGQIIMWVMLMRLFIIITVDFFGLLIARISAAVKKTEVQPYEEPFTKSEEFLVNTVGSIAIVLLVYAPSVSVFLFIVLLGWVLVGKYGGRGLVDPSGVGLTPKASEWNRKMLIVGALAIMWGGAYGLGHGRAQKLANGPEVGVLIGGELRPLIVVLQVSDGTIFYDPVAEEPVFVAQSRIQGFQSWEFETDAKATHESP